MEKIKNWFNEIKEEETDKVEIIDQLVSAISEKGFDSSKLDNWIDSELKKLDTNMHETLIKENVKN